MNEAVRSWRPVVPPQQDPFECGLVCICAIGAMFGARIPLAALRERLGGNTRGIKLPELNDLLRTVGATTRIFAFDTSRPSAYPFPAIVLLKRTHYVVIGMVTGDEVSLLDPSVGTWRTVRAERLAQELAGFALQVTGWRHDAVPAQPPDRNGLSRTILREALGRFGLRVLAIGALAQLVGLALPLAAGAFVNAAAPSTTDPVSTLAIGFTALTITGTLMTVVSRLLRERLEGRIRTLTSGWLIDRLAGLHQDFFDRRGRAGITHQVSAMGELQGFYGGLMVRFVEISVLSIVGVTAIAFVSPWLAVPGFIALAISAGLDLAFKKPLKERQAEMSNANLQLMRFTHDVLAQLPVFQRLHVELQVRARYRAALKKITLTKRKTATLQELRGALGMCIGAVENIVFMSVAGYFMYKDNLSLGAFVVAGLYKDQLKNAVGAAFDTWKRKEMLLIRREELNDLVDSSARAPACPVPVLTGRVQLQDLSYRYGKTEPEVLSGLCADLGPHEIIAVTGTSGVGKTTLARILLGSLTPTGGSVLIDGAPAASGRTGIAGYLQTDRLISGSLRENVVMFRRGYSDADVFDALKLAALESFARELPMGLLTPVADGLAGVSAGQRQRILLARTLLDRPKVLILDEATSNLDSRTEADIVANLRSLNSCVILITHRAEVWKMADRVLDLGKTSRPAERAQSQTA